MSDNGNITHRISPKIKWIIYAWILMVYVVHYIDFFKHVYRAEQARIHAVLEKIFSFIN